METLSPRWRKGVIWTILIGMVVLVYISATAYRNAPPIPGGVVDGKGAMVFIGEDILAGQEVYLKYALMENGGVWGHAAFIGAFALLAMALLALALRQVLSDQMDET